MISNPVKLLVDNQGVNAADVQSAWLRRQLYCKRLQAGRVQTQPAFTVI